MQLGFLTSPFRDRSLAQVAAWASQAGFDRLEVAVGQHIQPTEVLSDDGAAVRRSLANSRVQIGSLALYERWEPFADYERKMRDAIIAAEILGVECVCTFAGFPHGSFGKSRTLREVAPRVFEPLAREAERRNVRIAFENWFETNLQNLDLLKICVEALPYPNIGFNFDPSHLHWQGVDVFAAVEELGPRIFHTHAKDVTLFRTRMARAGHLALYHSFEFSIPGYGDIAWGPYIRALRRTGYTGVLSIEHEDAAFGPEEGFEKGLRYLKQLI